MSWLQHERLDHDDAPRGWLLDRRALLRRFGLFPVALLAACYARAPASPSLLQTPTPSPAGTARATVAGPDPSPVPSPTTAPVPLASGTATALVPSCVAVPALTEGPYFVDARLERSDIRFDPTDGTVVEGVPLTLTIRVSRVHAGCTPLSGALVDVWQCDANGVYSGVVDPQFDTRGKRFLRGCQRTDSDGVVTFVTIYPGWYRGRAVHIHFKVRTDPDAERGFEFTSQFFFDDALTDRIHAQPPYDRKGPRDTRNTEDGVFRQGGSQLVLPVVEDSQGLVASFHLGLAF